jgi:metal-responsive CopG/Arc/MetJ family transcriptional regulator
MKTAISLPDKLFQTAEAFAQEHGLSRSELYARALLLFLQAQRYEGITDALDLVYTDESSSLDPVLKAAQARALSKDTW